MYELLVGGVRAGKSGLAERMAAGTGRPVVVIATGTAGDEEMAARIARHRERRPPTWGVVEEPVAVGSALSVIGEDVTVVLDCVTLWISNLLGEGWADGAVEAAVTAVSGILRARPGSGIVVTNEVGSGVVPPNPLGRRFIDLLGWANVRLAANASRARLVVAGKVLDLADPEV